MSVISLEELGKRVKVGSIVLWVYRYNGTESVESGNVILRRGDVLDLIWLDGYKSRNDTIQMAEVLSIADTAAPSTVEVFPFSGKGYLTEAGLKWVQAHPRESRTA